MGLFKRRQKRTVLARIREVIWPSMGWKRMGLYFLIRIKRLPGTPYSIAAGFACGAAISFTPFVGLHFILGAVIAWLMRASLISSAIGTAVGNPWTFPFIWGGIYWLGTKILGYERGQELPAELTISVIFEQPTAIFIPMLIGGIPVALIVWIIFFFPIKRFIANYQKHRKQSRLMRREVLASQAQGGLKKTVNESAFNESSSKKNIIDTVGSRMHIDE